MRLFPSINELLFGRKMIIFDDVFPYLMTGFRVAEYNYYLRKYRKSFVFSSDGEFEKHKKEYDLCYPEFSDKIKKIENDIKYAPGSLAYTVFINNAYSFLPIIEKNKFPFIFTLYPGGGFQINDKISDNKLREVCSSKLLRKIITTQKITHEYLINNKFISEDRVSFIYGGVVASDYFYNNKFVKKVFGKDKKNLDICFVANKYIEKGLDKGYDVFIEVAKRIYLKNKNIYFHVVGKFSDKDIDVSSLGKNIKFYGIQYKDFFGQFYSGIDIILSPNIPFILSPGGFDGFPTGCCVEAGLSGVAVMCSDELNQNIKFKDGEEICIINRNVEDIVGKALYYYDNPPNLCLLSEKCKNAFQREFDINYQMKKRIEIFDNYL